MSDRYPEPEFDGLDPWKCPGCDEWRDGGPVLPLRTRSGQIGVCQWCYEDEYGPMPDDDEICGVPF